MSGGPVFVLSIHRSGSTLMERLLNCHPGLVIWGEHGGLINQFVEADLLLSGFPQLLAPLEGRGLGAFVDHRDGTEFNPWRTPVAPAGLRAQARTWMQDTFGSLLHPGQRWGFKEIRYGGAHFARYMLDLFPRGQFILVHRDPVALCVSNIFVDWSLAELAVRGDFQTEASVEAVVSDCAYAVAAMDWRLRRTAEVAGTSALSVQSEAAATEISRVFSFLGLPVDAEVRARLDEVIATRVGSTDKTRSIGRLTQQAVRELAPRLLATATQQIASQGLDRGRLLDVRGHCFLVGDHQSVGARRSAMGWTQA